MIEASYDATHLELASRRGLPLFTRDDELAQAALRLGSVVLPARTKRRRTAARKGEV